MNARRRPPLAQTDRQPDPRRADEPGGLITHTHTDAAPRLVSARWTSPSSDGGGRCVLVQGNDDPVSPGSRVPSRSMCDRQLRRLLK